MRCSALNREILKLGCLGGNNPNNPHHAEMQKCQEALKEVKECQREFKAANDRKALIEEEIARHKEEREAREEEQEARLAAQKETLAQLEQGCQEVMAMMDPLSTEYATCKSALERLASSAPSSELKEQTESTTADVGDCSTVEATGNEEEQKAPEKRVRFHDPDPAHLPDHPVRPNGP